MEKGNQKADANNANKGTKGTNKTYEKNQGNRGKQLNPNQKQDDYSKFDGLRDIDPEAYYAFGDD